MPTAVLRLLCSYRNKLRGRLGASQSPLFVQLSLRLLFGPYLNSCPLSERLSLSLRSGLKKKLKHSVRQGLLDKLCSQDSRAIRGASNEVKIVLRVILQIDRSDQIAKCNKNNISVNSFRQECKCKLLNVTKAVSPGRAKLISQNDHSADRVSRAPPNREPHSRPAPYLDRPSDSVAPATSPADPWAEKFNFLSFENFF